MADLDLRRLRYFVAVADSLSFVRAAAAVHMTQPALSRQIAALEHSLGTRLFERSRQGTTLTAAGQEILEPARELLAASAALERTARTTGRTASRFTIGFMPGTDAASIITAFQDQHPDLQVNAVFTSLADQVDFVTDGRVDIAFTRLPIGASGLQVVPLFDEALMAAVPRDHPLSDRRTVRLAELGRPYDLVTASVGPGAPSVDDVLLTVMTRGRPALIPAGLAAYHSEPGIAYLAVADGPCVEVALAYDRRRTLPHLGAFVAVCRDQLGPVIAGLPAVLAETRPEGLDA
ncbi:LysR family transcriptional regulator [Micropruina sp.]|uniref:LysR family transcriptional regulator n=1 Tax=Micropruina sp. TaxID=2737536 RepID=UPI0039E3E308